MSDVKSIKVEEYSLVDFVMKIQQGIRDGYEVNDTSDDAPIQIGGAFHLIMREAAKPNIVIGKAVFEASLDTTKLQEQLKVGGEIEQMLADSLVVEGTTTDDFLMVSDDIDEALSSGFVEEKLHGNLMGTIPITDEYVETIEPPKEPTLDEALPKEEQAMLQNKQPTKRGRK